MDLKIELFEITFMLYLPGKRSGYTTQHHHQVWLQHLTLIQVIFSSSDFYVEKKANCNTKAIDASDTARTTWIYYFTEMLLLPLPLHTTQESNRYTNMRPRKHFYKNWKLPSIFHFDKAYLPQFHPPTSYPAQLAPGNFSQCWQ